MAYIMDTTNVKRIEKLIDESVTGLPMLKDALRHIDYWCWENEGDENCVHQWDIRGAHDTRLYVELDGTWTLHKRWGSWSPGRCDQCGKTRKFDNLGRPAGKEEEEETEE